MVTFTFLLGLIPGLRRKLVHFPLIPSNFEENESEISIFFLQPPSISEEVWVSKLAFVVIIDHQSTKLRIKRMKIGDYLSMIRSFFVLVYIHDCNLIFTLSFWIQHVLIDKKFIKENFTSICFFFHPSLTNCLIVCHPLNFLWRTKTGQHN